MMRTNATSRRAVLGALTAPLAAYLLGGVSEAFAGRARSKLRRSESGAMGVTLTLALENAPFARKGLAYHDATVLVFVPHHHRLPKSRELDALIHFHGHRTTARRSMLAHRLREQLWASKQNAILVMPQGPRLAADSSGGLLERRGGFARMLRELQTVLRAAPLSRALGKASCAGVKRLGVTCLSAHSGGYRVAAACLRHGGVEIDEVYLFDALYGMSESYRRWLVAGRGAGGQRKHKLVSYYVGGAVRDTNLALLARLRQQGVRCLHELRPGRLSRAELVGGRAIFIASPLGHRGVTFRQNNLRDCLFASCFKRHQASDWFEHKHGPRPLERRS